MTLVTGNYVKFVRGTTALWNSLVTPDADTLYFIIDNGSTQGALYLGSTLIAGQVDQTTVSLSNLSDVLTTNLADKDILVYNETTGKWENKTIADTIANIVSVMVGATDTADGSAGLVPQPTAGQEGLFLRGSGTWANPTAAVELTLGTLIGTDANKSIRDIAKDEAANAVATIVGDADESFDTLKEISDWILSHPDVSEVTGLADRVSNLEDILNGTEGTEDQEGTDGLVTIVNNLQTLIYGDEGTGEPGIASDLTGVKSDIEALQQSMTTAEQNITTLQEALKWQVMIEDAQP